MATLVKTLLAPGKQSSTRLADQPAPSPSEPNALPRTRHAAPKMSGASIELSSPKSLVLEKDLNHYLTQASPAQSLDRYI